MLRISVITLIRTDTTLDLSQKAEKGKSLLRRPAAESRFSGPQAMTLSRQFYDPGEGAAKRRQLAGPRAFLRPPRPIFRPCIPPSGCPSGLLLVCGGLAAPGVGRSQGLPQRALGSTARHALGCPYALGCFRLAASLLFALWSAAFTSRSLAAAPPPRASSRKDCHRTALRRRRDQTNAARIAQRDPGTTKDKRVQPATAAAHTTHLT